MSPDELRAAGLLLDVTGPVATITLHRPEVRNAQTPAMWRALASVGESLTDDIRVVVRARQRRTASLPASTGPCWTRRVEARARRPSSACLG